MLTLLVNRKDELTLCTFARVFGSFYTRSESNDSLEHRGDEGDGNNATTGEHSITVTAPTPIRALLCLPFRFSIALLERAIRSRLSNVSIDACRIYLLFPLQLPLPVDRFSESFART